MKTGRFCLPAPEAGAVLILAAATMWITPVWAQEPAPTDELVVMSYNLKFASDKKPNAWPDRRPLMVELWQEINPDLVGTQEGLYGQLRDLETDLPAYAWIGTGRDGGSRGEFMAIFYRKERFEPLAFDHYWLSDTPSVIGSRTWGHNNTRMVTWVRFKDRKTGREFYHINTHLDHAVQRAREKAAALIRERTGKLDATVPVVLTGDFNATAGANKAYDILVQPDAFQDTWTMARTREGEGLASFNGFRSIPNNNRRIDWILIRGKASVSRSELNTFSKAGQFPSDHLPIIAWMQWE